MRLNYQEHSLKPGIYKILNTHNNRIYIGQCASFKKRWYQHQRSLINGKHQNKFLQNDFNKCRTELGHDNFLEFHVLEVMANFSKEERNKREEELIALHFDKQDLCYNFKQKAASKERITFSNTPEQTKELISTIQKRLWQDPEERQKRIEGSDGKRRERIGEAAKKVWAEKTQEDREMFGAQFQEITKAGWADPEIRSRRMAGLKANSWKVSEAHKKLNQNPEHRARLIAQGEASAKTYQVINPQGESVTIHNMTKFCRENGLTKQCMLRVCKGIDSSHKGWRNKK